MSQVPLSQFLDVKIGKICWYLGDYSFYRHKEAILNMMGIIIECEKKTNKYYISNPEELDDDAIGRWMLSTLTVNNALSDCAGIKNRILLENAPSGLISHSTSAPQTISSASCSPIAMA